MKISFENINTGNVDNLLRAATGGELAITDSLFGLLKEKERCDVEKIRVWTCMNYIIHHFISFE